MPNSPFSPSPIDTRKDLITRTLDQLRKEGAIAAIPDVTPITDPGVLIKFIRDELRTYQQLAYDARYRHYDDPEAISPWDALTQIHSGTENLLRVIDASKDKT